MKITIISIIIIVILILYILFKKYKKFLKEKKNTPTFIPYPKNAKKTEIIVNNKIPELSKEGYSISVWIWINDLDWKNLIFSHANLDILLSGTIPPNPTQLLASKKFKDFLESVSSIYDYVVIDSAPCLLVSDTFEISKNVDSTLYVVRANFTDKNLMNFVEESYQLNKFPGINIILNSVGNSAKYGYKYGYQYGYQYGYRYNYGYGYGYSEDK